MSTNAKFIHLKDLCLQNILAPLCRLTQTQTVTLGANLDRQRRFAGVPQRQAQRRPVLHEHAHGRVLHARVRPSERLVAADEVPRHLTRPRKLANLIINIIKLCNCRFEHLSQENSALPVLSCVWSMRVQRWL